MRRFIATNGWKAPFSKLYKAFRQFRRKLINRLEVYRLLFSWRNALLKQKKIRVSFNEINFYIEPEGSEAFNIWSGIRIERSEIRFLLDILQKDMVVLDIGSNIGIFSLVLGKQMAKIGGGRCYAFEPTRSTYQLLQKNIENNHYNNVFPIRTALSDQIGVAQLSINARYKDGLNTLGESTHPDAEIVNYEGTPVTTLDHWKNFNALNRVDIIKMDVEGCELLVLKGAKNLLSSEAPLIMYESSLDTTKGFGYHPVEIIWLLQKYGYKLFYLEGDTVKERPINLFHGTMIASKPFSELYFALKKRYCL
jgi:FkbM family methyltransferase